MRWVINLASICINSLFFFSFSSSAAPVYTQTAPCMHFQGIYAHTNSKRGAATAASAAANQHQFIINRLLMQVKRPSRSSCNKHKTGETALLFFFLSLFCCRSSILFCFSLNSLKMQTQGKPKHCTYDGAHTHLIERRFQTEFYLYRTKSQLTVF